MGRPLSPYIANIVIIRYNTNIYLYKTRLRDSYYPVK